MNIKHEPFLRHRGPITCAVKVGNSDRVVTAGYDSAVALFDIQQQSVSLLGYHQHLVNRVTVNSSGTRAVTASSDYNLYVWDLQNSDSDNRLLQVLRGHSDDVEDFVFISDELGASVSRDCRIIVWDLTTGAIRRIILGHDKDVLSVSYLEGKLYTSGDDMTLRIWDLDSGEQLAKFGPFETETDTCAIDPIHHRVILGCDDGLVRIFDINTHETVAELAGHESAIKKVAVSPANGDILSAAYDQKILIWDAGSFQQKQQLEARSGLWERSFNWSPDGASVVAGTFDGTVLTWDASSGECIAEIGLEGDQLGNACFNDVASLGNDQLAVVSDDGRVRTGVLSANQANWRHCLEPGGGRVLMNAVTWCEATQRVVCGTHDQRLMIFSGVEGDVPSQELTLDLQQGPVNCVRSSLLPDTAGELFVACYSGAVVRVDKHNQPNKYDIHENAVKALRLHHQREIGVSCCAGGELFSWDYQGKLLRSYVAHTAIIDDVDIDPSGQFIASAGRDFVLKVHGLDDGILYHNIHLGQRSPKALCFVSPEVVVVTNYWGELLRVSLQDGTILRQTIAANGISSIALHQDQLVVSSYDGAIYWVDKDDLSVKNTLRSMVQQIAAPAYA